MTPSRKRLLWGSVCFIGVSLLLKGLSPFPVLSYLAILLAGVYVTGLSFIHTYARKKNKELSPVRGDVSMTTDPATPSVSIIIPAHNEAPVIRETLLGMVEIKDPNYEILVVDDRSTDETGQILEETVALLREKGHTHVRCHIRAAQSVPGKSAVLNEALEMTQGEIVAVFDADARVSPDILTSLRPHFLDRGSAVWQLRKSISNVEDGPLVLAQELEYMLDTSLQTGRDNVSGAVELRGNGQFIRRQTLSAVGGWNHKTITDDLDLSTRLHAAGFKPRFLPHLYVHEQGVTGFFDLYKQRMRWAEGSLRRYLEFGGTVFLSRKTPALVKADIVFYMLNFLLPVVIFLDGLALLVCAPFVSGCLEALFWLCLTVPLMWVLSLVILVQSIRNHPEGSRMARLRIFLASCYMLVLWFPVIIGVYLRVLLRPEGPFRWNKAPRRASSCTEK